ncbi:aminotransferase class I/II-fold pyridoxal phosphate-dependent enzyme [Candidatus Woesearchaeota archaeon]|nr:aminotransferase class I/II-fold pyridoxal phosphate-dependent enzyme [Candidatus Woesearchaeota archaeon]
MKQDNQAEELNGRIKKCNKGVFGMLSSRGRGIYFPKAGILAQSQEAKGTRLNATIGIAVEDDSTPMRLNSIAKNIKLSPNDAFSYAPSFGRPEFRQRWKEMLYKKNPSLDGRKISAPVASCGLTHGLSVAGYLFAEESDSIILPSLYWENYGLIFENTYGAKLDAFECFENEKLNIEGLGKKLAGKGKKKIVLLNFPNNPCGYTPTVQEVKEIAIVLKAAAKNSRIVTIIDDAYLGLVYREGIFRESIFSCLAGLDENVLAVKIDGISKEDYAWGLRIGFITFGIRNGSEELYSALESKAAGAVRAVISNAQNISQSLVLKAYQSKDYERQKAEKYQILKSRFDEVVKVLDKNPNFKEEFEALPFNSGYFMCIKTRKSADAVRKKLIAEYSTGVIADKGIIRIAFSSLRKDSIAGLFENIYNACRSI